MEDAYYISKNGEQIGPVNQMDIHAMLENGTITYDDYVFIGNKWEQLKDSHVIVDNASISDATRQNEKSSLVTQDQNAHSPDAFQKALKALAADTGGCDASGDPWHEPIFTKWNISGLLFFAVLSVFIYYQQEGHVQSVLLDKGKMLSKLKLELLQTEQERDNRKKILSDELSGKEVEVKNLKGEIESLTAKYNDTSIERNFYKKEMDNVQDNVDRLVTVLSKDVFARNKSELPAENVEKLREKLRIELENNVFVYQRIKEISQSVKDYNGNLVYWQDNRKRPIVPSLVDWALPEQSPVLGMLNSSLDNARQISKRIFEIMNK